MRRSGSIALVLIGTSLAAMGFSAHHPKPPPDDSDDPSVDGYLQFVYPSNGYHHYSYTSWFDDYRHSSWSSSGSRSSFSTSSHTTRGGFGSTGHSGHS